MKTYLTVASHWNVPGIRQYASTERVHAEAKAVELVDELREDFHRYCDRETWRGDHVPPSVANGGGDWRATLAALQLARLIDYYGGEGEANDQLFAFGERSPFEFPGEPPLIGEGFTAELQRWIAGFVAEDDADSDGIGFPMVWIEEVETLQTSLGEITVTGPADEVPPLVTFNMAEQTAFAGINLGDVLSVIGWAKQFTDDWLETGAEFDGEREQAAAACGLVDRVSKALPHVLASLGNLDDVLDTASGAITSLDEQLDQLKRFTSPTFDDDEQLQAAEQEGVEAQHMVSHVRKALKLIERGEQPETPSAE